MEGGKDKIREREKGGGRDTRERRGERDYGRQNKRT